MDYLFNPQTNGSEMMKVAVIGGTGRAGSQIVEELARRGHSVVVIARNVGEVAPGANVETRAVDMHDKAALIDALKGSDAVVSAVRFSDVAPADLIAAVKAAGVTRYLVVGGAASLMTPGGRLFDSPHFPEAYKAEAGAGAAFLEILRGESALDWSFLSPSMIFDGSDRTGTFRLGKDDLLTAADGKSSISFPDYAIAMADEIETPKHSKARFTVGY
jgi:putative NADH-flavin reductase